MSPHQNAPTLTLWRENRIDQQWSLSTSRIAERFAEWLTTHQPPQNFARALALFIADPDGLNSTWEPKELWAIEGQIYTLARDAWAGYGNRIERDLELERGR